jgi:hypothetical protein
MALGFAIFTISKRMANSSQNDLVNQLDGISKSMYTDLDQQVITGARLKQVVNQASTTDCAIIVETLGFLGAQVKLQSGSTTTSPEATLNGNVGLDFKDGKVPVVRLANMSLNTSLGTTIAKPYAVNFGSVLKNSVVGATNSSGEYKSAIASTDGTAANLAYTTANVTGAAGTATTGAAKDYSASAEYNQEIQYKDGQFTTKLEFLTNASNSRIIRYDMISDMSKSGKTFSIPDTAQYNSYVLVNASGDYMGLVFCQLRK